ncbi:MAG: ABC transporter permease [Gemmatimonadetes bacterium]|nr:ABC transporter permease [Gemmatimonadota bacterium]
MARPRAPWDGADSRSRVRRGLRGVHCGGELTWIGPPPRAHRFPPVPGSGDRRDPGAGARPRGPLPGDDRREARLRGRRAVSLPIWRIEWRIAIRRRRLLAFNVGIPLLLVVPLSFGGAPAYHASSAYTMLFVLFGTFGSAIPLLREGDGGPLRRILLTGFPEPAFVTERVLAGSALDLLQLFPAMALVLGAGRAGTDVWVAAIPALILAFVAANLVGLWVAALARSIAEGALLAAVVSLFLLHGSGVFRTPAPDSWGAILESVLPYRALHETFLAGTGGLTEAPMPAGLLVPAVTTALLFAVTVGCSSKLLERISDPIR